MTTASLRIAFFSSGIDGLKLERTGEKIMLIVFWHLCALLYFLARIQSCDCFRRVIGASACVF